MTGSDRSTPSRCPPPGGRQRSQNALDAKRPRRAGRLAVRPDLTANHAADADPPLRQLPVLGLVNDFDDPADVLLDIDHGDHSPQDRCPQPGQIVHPAVAVASYWVVQFGHSFVTVSTGFFTGDPSKSNVCLYYIRECMFVSRGEKKRSSCAPHWSD